MKHASGTTLDTAELSDDVELSMPLSRISAQAGKYFLNNTALDDAPDVPVLLR